MTKTATTYKHGNVSLWSLIWWHVDDVGADFLPTYCHDVGGDFLPWWCWWAFLAMMMMGQNSLLAKCIVVAPQNRCRTNVTKTECECRQSLTHLLTKKNTVVQKKRILGKLNLISWQTVHYKKKLGGKDIWQFSAHCLTKGSFKQKLWVKKFPFLAVFDTRQACSSAPSLA